MVKKRYRIYRTTILLAKYFLLKGMLLPETTVAKVNNFSVTPERVISDKSRSLGTDLYLDVTLNETHAGLAHFGYAEGKLSSSVATLRQLGFLLPEGTPDPVFLDKITQLHIDYDARKQTLKLTAPLSLLEVTTTELNQTDIPSTSVTVSPGMLLNYDIYGAQNNIFKSANTFSELRIFNHSGVLSSTQLTQYSTGDNNVHENNRATRLDTHWRSSFPDKLTFVTLGDTLTRSLSWSRPTRIAGVQVGTDFSLQPYLPVVPLPVFFGSATLPSNVELYINGIKRYTGRVPVGSFELQTPPSITGAGSAQVMLTDALGRTTTQNFSFYNDNQLLRPGLMDWSVEFGSVRKNYGLSSFDYSRIPALSGTGRYGVNNTFTSGMHAEATNSLVNIGVSGDWMPAVSSGTLSSSVAFSRESRQNGFLYNQGYRWSSNRFNVSLSGTASSEKYKDIAARYGASPLAFNGNAVAGYSTELLGNISVNYLHFRYPEGESVRYCGANLFK